MPARDVFLSADILHILFCHCSITVAALHDSIHDGVAGLAERSRSICTVDDAVARQAGGAVALGKNSGLRLPFIFNSSEGASNHLGLHASAQERLTTANNCTR